MSIPALAKVGHSKGNRAMQTQNTQSPYPALKGSFCTWIIFSRSRSVLYNNAAARIYNKTRQWLCGPVNKFTLLINHMGKEVLGVLCTACKVEIPGAIITPGKGLKKKRRWEMRSVPRSILKSLQQIKLRGKKPKPKQHIHFSLSNRGVIRQSLCAK